MHCLKWCRFFSKQRGCRCWCWYWCVNVWEDFNLTFFTGLKLRLRYFLFLMKRDHRSAPENVSFVNLSTIPSSSKCSINLLITTSLFYSLLLSQLPLNVCVFSFLFLYGRFEALKVGLCECILTWVLQSLNFLLFLSHCLQQHRCALLVISASNFFSSRIAFLSCSVPCSSSDHCCVTCMTSVILLTFSSSTLTVCDLSLLPCVSCIHTFALLTPRTGAQTS